MSVISVSRSRPVMPAKLWSLSKEFVWPVLMTALLLAGWEVAVRALHIRSIILPPPSQVIAVMIERYDLLFEHLWPSLYLTILGFALSVAGGIAFAVLITYST